MARRSVLFSPGNEESLLRKAATTAADSLVFDLEDAVAPGAKDAARETVSAVLGDPEFNPAAEVCVRVNEVGQGMEADLDAVAGGETRDLDTVLLPKVSEPRDVEELSDHLAERDLKVDILVLLETAQGVLQAESIASAQRVDGLVFGAEDLAADIGATRTEEGTEVLHAREHVILAATAHGVDAIDTVFTDYTDRDGLTSEARFAIQLGFDGKLAIHPDQVPVINEAFTPDQADIEWAERIVEARESTGRAVFQVDGEMIDAPLIAQAERILERARAADQY